MGAALLADMSVGEQRELYDQLAFKFAKAKKSPAPLPEENEFWKILCDALRAVKGSGIHLIPLPAYIEQEGHAAITKAMESLDALIKAGCPYGTRKPLRMEVLRLVLAALMELMQDMGAPLTPKTIINMSHWAGEAIDRQYPGYATAHILDRIVSFKA